MTSYLHMHCNNCTKLTHCIFCKITYLTGSLTGSDTTKDVFYVFLCKDCIRLPAETLEYAELEEVSYCKKCPYNNVCYVKDDLHCPEEILALDKLAE